MVTHDEDPVLGNHDFKSDVGWVDLALVGICVEVTGLVKGVPVDGDPTLAGATNDLVSWQPDDAIDQMARGAPGRQPDELQHLVPRRRIISRLRL